MLHEDLFEQARNLKPRLPQVFAKYVHSNRQRSSRCATATRFLAKSFQFCYPDGSDRIGRLVEQIMSLPQNSKRRHSWRFSLRSLLALILVLCTALGWYAVQMRSAVRQQDAIKAVAKLGGSVTLDYGEEYEASLVDSPENGGPGPAPIKPWPEWLRRGVGDHFLFGVRDINLYHQTGISDSDLTVLASFPRARGLNLHYSPITDDGFRHASGLKGLHHVSLGHTRITARSLEVIAGFTELRSLDLQGTAIDDESLKHLRHLTCLEQLYLDTTLITDASLAHLAGLTGLTHLGLESTPISGVGFKHLKNLRRLQTIYLKGSDVNNEGLGRLPCKGTIRSLNLGDTHVSDAGLAALADFSALRQLRLSGSAFTDDAVSFLKRLPQLERLILSETILSRAAIDDLKTQGIFVTQEAPLTRNTAP